MMYFLKFWCLRALLMLELTCSGRAGADSGLVVDSPDVWPDTDWAGIGAGLGA